MVAPTTAPKDPSGSTPALSRASLASTPPATVPPSEVVACCTSGPSLLDVSASTNTPAPWRRAVSIIGSSEPKPRNGLAVTASAATGEAGSR
jgi:hypothetical protein